MPPHSRKTAKGPPMEMSEYDETRATARLPNLDIEIVHRRPWEGNEEHLVVTLRAVPSFEAFGRFLEANRKNSPGRRPACSSGPIYQPANDGWHGLAGAGSGPAV